MRQQDQRRTARDRQARQDLRHRIDQAEHVPARDVDEDEGRYRRD